MEQKEKQRQGEDRFVHKVALGIGKQARRGFRSVSTIALRDAAPASYPRKLKPRASRRRERKTRAETTMTRRTSPAQLGTPPAVTYRATRTLLRAFRHVSRDTTRLPISLASSGHTSAELANRGPSGT